MASNTPHATATSGTTVALNRSAMPAIAPHSTGRCGRAAHAAACSPTANATMTGQDPKKVE